MSDDTVLACPECKSTRIKRRTSGVEDKRRISPDPWYCQICRDGFETPARRPDRGEGNYLKGLAARLDKADPDEVVADD